LFHKTK